jgi:GNAT superfamily N-acetyltransferase
MITVRRYRKSDAEGVGQLIADTYDEYNLSFASPAEKNRLLGPFQYARSPEKDHRTAIARVIAAPLVLVAVDNSEIVGVLRGGRRDRQQRAVLQSLFVKGDHHRQGIGRRLVERFEHECVRQGATVIRLAATLYAVPFYLQMGYRRSTGVRSGTSFEGSGIKIQAMRKTLRRA